jgi:ankyrin repeat protein
MYQAFSRTSPDRGTAAYYNLGLNLVSPLQQDVTERRETFFTGASENDILETGAAIERGTTVQGVTIDAGQYKALALRWCIKRGFLTCATQYYDYSPLHQEELDKYLAMSFEEYLYAQTSERNTFVQIFKFLVSKGANPGNINTPLIYKAALGNDAELLEFLLNDKRVVLRGHHTTSEDLSYSRIIVDDYINQYPDSDSIEILTLLFKDDRFKSELDNALYHATARKHINQVKLLLAYGANPASNYAILQTACQMGFTEIVKILLETNADPQANDSGSLRWASYSGRTDIVKLLLDDKRADPTAQESLCLRHAVDQNKPSVVQLLLEDGRAIPTNAMLQDAVDRNENPSVVRLLLIDGRAIPTNAMLQHACYKNSVQIVKYLLENNPIHSYHPSHSLDLQTVNIRRVVFRANIIGDKDGVVLALIEYGRVFTEEELLTMIPFCLDEPLEALLAIQPELFESKKVRKELGTHSKYGVLRSILK